MSRFIPCNLYIVDCSALHGCIPLGIFEETVRNNCQFFSHIATLADVLLQKSFHDIPAKPLASLC
jgi:hypothetical protein